MIFTIQNNFFRSFSINLTILEAILESDTESNLSQRWALQFPKFREYDVIYTPVDYFYTTSAILVAILD